MRIIMLLIVSLEEKFAAAYPLQRLDLISREWDNVSQSECLGLLELLHRALRFKKPESTEVIYHTKAFSARSNTLLTVSLRWIYPAGIHDFQLLHSRKTIMEIRCGSHITSGK